MYYTAHLRKRGDFWHLIFEYQKNGMKKKISKSRSSGTKDEEVARKMLLEYEIECIKLYGIKVKEKKNNKILENFKEIKNLYDKEISFCDFIFGYVKMRYKTITDETYSSYLGMTRNSLIPYFFKENKKLKEINNFDIERYYYHELNMRGVSKTTVNHYHNLLSLVFKYALRIGIINENIILKVQKPKKDKYIAKTYNSEEIKNLLDLLKKENKNIYFGVLISSYLGLRRSEVIGLKWSSINFEDNTLSILSTVTETNIDGKRKLIFKDRTKGIASLRTFSIPLKIREILLEMKEEQEKNKSYFGRGYLKKYEDYVYVNEVGELYKPNYITVQFGKFIKEHKLPHIRFHDLRHSCATMLYQSNVNVKDIQAYMGHSSAKTTMDIYVHLMNKNNTATVSLISDKIGI